MGQYEVDTAFARIYGVKSQTPPYLLILLAGTLPLLVCLRRRYAKIGNVCCPSVHMHNLWNSWISRICYYFGCVTLLVATGHFTWRPTRSSACVSRELAKYLSERKLQTLAAEQALHVHHTFCSRFMLFEIIKRKAVGVPELLRWRVSCLVRLNSTKAMNNTLLWSRRNVWQNYNTVLM